MHMTRQRPNILLITTDEHRYDCLGCYGNPVIRTPHIDSIAQEGVRFERGYVQNPMCMPSRMSIMTGRYCSEHGCNINCTGIPAHEQQNTFMQHLCDAGYHTAAIGKMHMMPKWGPFGFSYLDLVEGKADRNNQYTDYYYGNITLVDDQVGRVLDVLERRGLVDETLIAFTSDHGDLLGDHLLLLKSGVTFYEGCVRVPYLIRYPQAFPRGAVCHSLVESIDLAPTFLELAGADPPATMQGRSLVGLADGKLDDWRDDAFSEIDLTINPRMHGPHDPGSRDYVAMICTRDWKYVHLPTLGIGELYHLAQDPHELYNLFYEPEYADKVAGMRLRLLNRFMHNQRPFVGEQTETFRRFYDSDHRPPAGSSPGVIYAPGEPS